MIKRAVWSFYDIPGRAFTPLQKVMLLASPLSLKQVEKVHCVLYTDPKTKQLLESRLGKDSPFEEIMADDIPKDINLEVWWDYPKWSALAQEQEKVFYSDYDIVYYQPFFKELGDYNWVWCFETIDVYYRPHSQFLVSWEELPKPVKKVIPKYRPVAYNTGVLVLDPVEIQICKLAFEHYAKKLGNLTPSETISVTQAGLNGFVAVPKTFCSLDKGEPMAIHHLGGWKMNPDDKHYREVMKQYLEDFNPFFSLKSVKSFVDYKTLL